MSVNLPKALELGDPTKLNWRAINLLREASRQHEVDLNHLGEIIARIQRQRPETDNVRLPFEVYLRPLYKYAEGDERDERELTWWRTFFVRHGYTDLKATEGCDDADDEGVTELEIEVPDDTGDGAYWIWVEIDEDGRAQLQQAEEIDGLVEGWDDFPIVSATLRPIARIRTHDGEQPAEVRQLQFGDIWTTGSGGGPPVYA